MASVLSRFSPLRVSALLVALLLVQGCAAPVETVQPPPAPALVEAERPLPHAITPPLAFRRAMEAGTRTTTGEPGPAYWQNRVRYAIDARLDIENKRIDGVAEMVYTNASPYELPGLVVDLAQNLHAEGVPRNEPAEVTGGVEVAEVRMNGMVLPQGQEAGQWFIQNTKLIVQLGERVPTGSETTLSVTFGYTIPQAGAGARMGYEEDELVFLAYWYPQMAVFDDVYGWHLDDFLGQAEFYSDFGDYTVSLDVPAGWLVEGTGRLQNPDAVLAPAVRARLDAARQSDTPVRVVDAADAPAATLAPASGRLVWEFQADNVRDVAYSATRTYNWDVARTPVGDLDGDGAVDYAQIGSIWRDKAPLWSEVAAYSQHSITFFSEYLDFPYPYPHMTAVEGGGIIGGGMEFPMMTLMGDYNERGADALYWVTAHELAHMWMPMIVSTNERRYSWMDEGNTTFNENQARRDYFDRALGEENDRESYLNVARADAEGEILRWSNFHYPGPAFGVASYSKPATVLVALRRVLGDDVFLDAFRTYMARWAYKHPYPWDFFNTFEDVSGRDLDWFWHTWYEETWTLDQAIADVRTSGGGATVTIRDLGDAPMPVYLTVTRQDGTTDTYTLPVDTWLTGTRTTTFTVPTGSPVTSVAIDAQETLPDTDRSNNAWNR